MKRWLLILMLFIPSFAAAQTDYTKIQYVPPMKLHKISPDYMAIPQFISPDPCLKTYHVHNFCTPDFIYNGSSELDISSPQIKLTPKAAVQFTAETNLSDKALINIVNQKKIKAFISVSIITLQIRF